MKQRFIYFYPILVLVSLMLISCDILDEKIVSGVTAETHYQTPEGFEDAVNASYAFLRSFYGSETGGK